MNFTIENSGLNNTQNEQSEINKKKIKNLQREIVLNKRELAEFIDNKKLSPEQAKIVDAIKNEIAAKEKACDELVSNSYGSKIIDTGNKIDKTIQNIAGAPIKAIENSNFARVISDVVKVTNTWIENYGRKINSNIEKRARAKAEIDIFGKKVPIVKVPELIQKESGEEEVSNIMKVVEVLEFQLAKYLKDSGKNSDKKTINNYKNAIKKFVDKAKKIAADRKITIDKSLFSRKEVTASMVPDRNIPAPVIPQVIQAQMPKIPEVEKESKQKVIVINNVETMEQNILNNSTGSDSEKLSGEHKSKKVIVTPSVYNYVPSKKTANNLPKKKNVIAYPAYPQGFAAGTPAPVPPAPGQPGTPAPVPPAPGQPGTPAPVPPAPGQPGTPAQTPQGVIGNPKVEYAKFLEVCDDRGTGNLAKQIGQVIPGFDALPEGQKMLILQGMNDQLLTHVNEKAVKNFQKSQESKGGLGKFIGTLTKSYKMANFKKQELALLTGDGGENTIERLEFLKAKAPGLMEVFGKNGIDGYLDKKGRSVIADFSNRKELENASPKLKKAAEDYNELANKFAHLSPDDKEGRAKMEKKLGEAREAYTKGLIEKARSEGIPDPEFNVSIGVKRREILMRTMSAFSADEYTTSKLIDIAKRPVLLQAFSDIWAQRGGSIALGYGLNMAKKAGLAVAGGLVIAGAPITAPMMISVALTGSLLTSGILGYIRGKERAVKSMKEKDLLARGGVIKKEKLSKEVQNNLAQLNALQQVYDAKFPRTADYKLAPLTPEQETERMTLLQEMQRLNSIVAIAKQKEGTNIGMGSVTRHLDRLEKLQTELANSISPIQKKEVLSRMKTIHDFIEAKLQRNEVNFLGKDKDENQIFLNQNKLFTALFDAQLAMQYEKFEPEVMNIFDPKAPDSQLAFGNVANVHKDGSVQDVHFRERLINTGKANSDNTEKARKNFERTQARNSALYGAAFSSLTFGLAHYAEGHWSIPDSVKNFFHHEGTVPAPTPSGVWNVGPDGWHPPMALPKPGTQINPNEPFDWNKFLTNQYNTDAQHPIHHPEIHHHVRVDKEISKLPTINDETTPPGSLDDQIKNLKPIEMPDLPKPVNPFLDHVPNFNEVNGHQFDVDEMKTIDVMAERDTAEKLKEFFPDGKHARLLNRDVDRFLDRNEGAITNEGKSDLHKYFVTYEQETGDAPREGETVGNYLKRIEKFHAEQDYLQGKNIPIDDKLEALDVRHHQRIIDNTLGTNGDNSMVSDATPDNAPNVNLSLAEQQSKWIEESLEGDLNDKDRLARKVSDWNAKEFLENAQKGKYDDLQSDLRVFIQQNKEGIALNDNMTVKELMEKIAIANPRTIEKGVPLHSMIEASFKNFLSGKNLEIENLENGLTPNEISWADKNYPVGSTQADDILAADDFKARVNEHMEYGIKKINEFGNNGVDNNFFDKYKNKTINEFLQNSANDQNLDYKGLREVILKFEKLNRGFPIDKNQKVEDFIRNVYTKNEYAKFIHEKHDSLFNI